MTETSARLQASTAAHAQESSARLRSRLRSLPAAWFDTGLAVVFVAIVAAELLRTPAADGTASLLAGVLTSILGVSLALRRRTPLAACVAATAALTAESAQQVATDFSPTATLVCAYSVGLHPNRSRALWGPPVVVVGVLGFFTFTPGLDRADPVEVVSVLLVWLAAWVVGYSTARRRDEQQRARRAIGRQVVAEERMRMSRELHDLVGHTVNLLVVQSGAARLMLDRDPAAARELLRGMERTGRETLADLDRVLASLSADSTEPSASLDGLTPTPGLAQLPDLVERFTDSGVQVTLRCDPTLRLPRDLDLSAYRVVQEALTNALKHAAPCSATVSVRRDNGSMVIEVSDTGPGLRATNGRGRGLAGMRERVLTSGGTLEYGKGPGGGFHLRAVLPLP